MFRTIRLIAVIYCSTLPTLHAATRIDVSTQPSALPTSLSMSHYQLLEKHHDMLGIEHSRYQQYYHHIPIWNAYLTTHHGQGASIAHHGLFYDNLHEDLGESPPQTIFKSSWTTLLSREDIINLAQHTTEPVIYIDEHDHAHWAWSIQCWINPPHDMPKQLHFILDQTTGKIFKKWNHIQTASSSESTWGQGFGGNLKTGLKFYDGIQHPLPITRNTLNQTCDMKNQEVTILDMHHHYYKTPTLTTFDCPETQPFYWTGINQDGYDKINDAYSPTNDALYLGLQLKHMYEDWFHLSFDKAPLHPFVFVTHYGQNFENAFWDGQQMFFGDGYRKTYPLVSPTVMAHELSHAITDRYSRLVYDFESGAINESFSDIAAQMFQFYLEGHNTWTIGEEIMKGPHSALRNMAQPSLDGRSIEHIKYYLFDMDVHYASGIYNRFFYLLANAPGWDIRTAFEVILKANQDYWIPTSHFEDAAQGVLWAAQDLHRNPLHICHAFNAVGIHPKDCQH